MENPRTTSARDHDDHELIDAAASDSLGGQPADGSRGLAADVNTQSELARVGDPDGRVRPQKDDMIHHDQRRASGKPRDMTG
jgi:hypothetical protein